MRFTFKYIMDDGKVFWQQFQDRPSRPVEFMDNGNPQLSRMPNLKLAFMAIRIIWIEEKKYVKNRSGSTTDSILTDMQ